jgi:sterol desaturase/sphingolipid hydroxylase (fatty acid hydroxylase superfamily)
MAAENRSHQNMALGRWSTRFSFQRVLRDHTRVAKERVTHQEEGMTIGTILLIVLVLVLIGALPTWGYSRSWGYRPTGGIGLVLLIVVILLLLGYI